MMLYNGLYFFAKLNIYAIFGQFQKV